ncbi:MAG: hypothetical protein SOX84_03035, partial [Prevotella sp.]|nr:hypothetical protein [Prevotella sp.]MDY4217742.1 hypothetical protein [Prevotella sp.]
QDEGQTHIVFGEVAKDSTILSFYMGKAKGFLTAIQHQEILMTDLGLSLYVSSPDMDSRELNGFMLAIETMSLPAFLAS